MAVVMTRITEHATEILSPDAYRTDDWHEARRTAVSASEIAAVLGISPWTSAFDLYWSKRTGDRNDVDNAQMRRGRRREQAILDDFTDEHPEFMLGRVGLVANDDRPWQVATPDALVYDANGCDGRCGLHDDIRQPLAVVEAKTDGGSAEWGEEHSDEIPVHYRAQVIWQMDTLGLSVAYVPVWHGFGYREYVVEYDETDARLMRDAAARFLEDVASGREPDVDAHRATTRRLKHLHPELTDETVQVSGTLVRQYQLAARLRRAAENRMKLAENRLRHELGSAVEGRVGNQRVVTHSIYTVAEHVRTASTTDRLNFTRKEVQP